MIKKNVEFILLNLGWVSIDEFLWLAKHLVDGLLGEGDITERKLEDLLVDWKVRYLDNLALEIEERKKVEKWDVNLP